MKKEESLKRRSEPAVREGKEGFDHGLTLILAAETDIERMMQSRMETLRAVNHLRSDFIREGQRLRVR